MVKKTLVILVVLGALSFIAVPAQAIDLESQGAILKAQLETSQMEIKWLKERYSVLISIIKRQQNGLKDLQKEILKDRSDKAKAEKEALEKSKKEVKPDDAPDKQ